jgi:lysophospholipase L1-like esterase
VGSVVALGVPLIQAAVIWRTERPPIPGPHDQNGVLPGLDDAVAPVPCVWLGDSLACGVGAATPDAALPRRAAALWSAGVGRPVHLTCLARPGSRAVDVLAEQVPAACELLGPDALAVITVGANDVRSLTRARHFRRSYAAILASLQATGATVVAIGLPDLGSAVVIPHPLRAVARFAGHRTDRRVRQLAAAHGAHYVSIDVRAPRRTEWASYLAADRWHPNDETYRLWADRVAALVTPLLALRTGS